MACFAVVCRLYDLDIYLWGGRAVTSGMPPYLAPVQGNWFTYPPFAAALFTSLAVIPGPAVRLAWSLGSVAALGWACA